MTHLFDSIVVRQTLLLLRMAGNDTQRYVGVSLVVGVLVPCLLYAALLLTPRRFLLPVYWLLNFALGGFLLFGWISAGLLNPMP